MRLSDAFDTIEQWSKEGKDAGNCAVRYGYLIIDKGGIGKGLTWCPVCGATTGMGHIEVSHDDGRRVRIDVQLYHYVQVGHSISQEQLDSELLCGMLADANTPPAALAHSELTIEDAMEQIQHIQQNGEQIGRFVRRTGRIMVHVGGLKEGTQYCIHCGEPLGKGRITVMHEDQRMVTFDPAMFHYVEAGHPFTMQQLDSQRLLAILGDQ